MKYEWVIALLFAIGFSAFSEGPMVVVVREELAAPAEVKHRTRRLPDKWAMPLYTQPGEAHRVIVKFKDDFVARADSKANRLMLAKGPVDELQFLMNQYGISLEPLIKLPEQKLRDFENRAARRSGRSQPDFAGIMAVVMPDRSAENAREVAQALRALNIVEYVEIDTPESPPPPPSDYDPTTPDLSMHQGYRLPDPGIDIEYAWSNGYKGAGIRVSDCEYGFHTNHEDLVDSTFTVEIAPGESVTPSYIDHGTAVLGVLGATENAYGMTGLVPLSDFHFYSEEPASGYDRYTAIASAIMDSDSGDIVLLEMQSAAGAPAEFYQSSWDLTKSGTDAGVIVVAAAGNGAEDLDSAFYSAYRARGDSGAILVGAGTSDTNHSKMGFSTYGTRVNLQGWGTSVATLGYGSFAEYGEDINQRYTTGFNGTSAIHHRIQWNQLRLADRGRCLRRVAKFCGADTGVSSASVGNETTFNRNGGSAGRRNQRTHRPPAECTCCHASRGNQRMGARERLHQYNAHHRRRNQFFQRETSETAGSHGNRQRIPHLWKHQYSGGWRLKSGVHNQQLVRLETGEYLHRRGCWFFRLRSRHSMCS